MERDASNKWIERRPGDLCRARRDAEPVTGRGPAARVNPRDAQLRQRLAREAARVMAEGGIQDFALAKRKALERLRLPAGTALPRNAEIEEARLEYQRLFGGEERAREVAGRRAAAVSAMREFAHFEPRLVGPLLSDGADGHSAVCLHLFAESAEEVGWYLMERGIPHRNSEQRLRMSGGETERVPGYSFLAGGVPVDLLVFSGRSRRHTPLSPVDGRAMRRAGLAEVEALLAATGP